MQITKPTLILDKKRCMQNIESMQAKAEKKNLIFRPHFKTHQSLAVGRWFKKLGIDKITVSSVDMAKYFASDGWRNITIAFPVNLLEIDAINALAKSIKLNITLLSLETVRELKSKLSFPAGFFIKIDAGYHRTGIDIENVELIDQILEEAQEAPLLNFKGFLVHNGHTYHTKSKEEILNIHNNSAKAIQSLRKRYTDYENLLISFGDTPSCSLSNSFKGIDEIRPGNFVFYDIMQQDLGACDYKQIAVALACPIVAAHPERNELVIYGGAVHLSKDYITVGKKKVFGKVVRIDHNKRWGAPIEGLWVEKLSQEHGIIKGEAEAIQSFKPGDLLGILPVHSCLTADAMRGYFTPENQFIDHLSGNNLE